MLWFDLVIIFAALARGMNASGSAVSLGKKRRFSGVKKGQAERKGEGCSIQRAEKIVLTAFPSVNRKKSLI